jgi:hypothetical protein
MGYTFDLERVHSALSRLSDRVGSEAAVKAVVAGLTRRGIAAQAVIDRDNCGHWTPAVEVAWLGRRITICCPCY